MINDKSNFGNANQIQLIKTRSKREENGDVLENRMNGPIGHFVSSTQLAPRKINSMATHFFLMNGQNLKESNKTT